MNIQEFFAGLSALFAQGKKEDVRPYLLQGLENAEREGDESAVVTILNEMIGYFRSVSEYAEAIRASERALGELRRMGLENSPACGTTLLNAATAFRAAGENAKAMDLYQKARAIYEENLPEDDPRLAGLYNNISSLHEAGKDYEAARAALRRALDILSRADGMEDETATVLTNYALICLKQNDTGAAMDALFKAEKLFLNLMAAKGSSRPSAHYASTLAGLAEAHWMADDAQASQALQTVAAYYERALEHIRACYGENNDYAVTCANYARLLREAGKEDEAAELENKAAEITRRIFHK